MLTAPPRPRRGPLLVATAAVVVAAGLAVSGLVALLSANDELSDAEAARGEAFARLAEARSDDLEFARTRDEVAEFARHAVAVMNTMDHRTVDEDLAAWAEVSAGTLREEVTNLGEDRRKQLADARSVTEGEVLSLAVRELDARAGTATALAAVKVSVSTGGQDATNRYQRFEAALNRTDQGWRLTDLARVQYVEPGS